MCFSVHGPSSDLPLWYIVLAVFLIGFAMERWAPARTVRFEVATWALFSAASFAVMMARFTWMLPGCDWRDFGSGSLGVYVVFGVGPLIGALLYRARFQGAAAVGSVRRAIEVATACVAGLALVFGGIGMLIATIADLSY